MSPNPITLCGLNTVRPTPNINWRQVVPFSGERRAVAQPHCNRATRLICPKYFVPPVGAFSVRKKANLSAKVGYQQRRPSVNDDTGVRAELFWAPQGRGLTNRCSGHSACSRKTIRATTGSWLFGRVTPPAPMLPAAVLRAARRFVSRCVVPLSSRALGSPFIGQ